MSAAERKAVGERMRTYWAARKEARQYRTDARTLERHNLIGEQASTIVFRSDALWWRLGRVLPGDLRPGGGDPTVGERRLSTRDGRGRRRRFREACRDIILN